VLKKEVEKAWRLVETAKTKEETARKIIQDLRGEIAHLHKIVHQGTGMAVGGDTHVTKLMQEKDELNKTVKSKEEQVVDLEAAKSNLQEHIIRLEADLQRERDEEDKLRLQVEQYKEEVQRETRKFKIEHVQCESYAEQVKDYEVKQKSLENQKSHLTDELTKSKEDFDKLVQTKAETDQQLKERGQQYQHLVNESN